MIDLARRPHVFVSTGSTSADLLAAAVLAELGRRGDVGLVTGIGGAPLVEQGVRVLFDTTAHSAVGFAAAMVEFRSEFAAILSAMRGVARHLRGARPDLVLLVDNPGYNLRLLEKAHGCRLPTLYFVPPELWGLFTRQARWLARTADQVVPIFDADAAAYRRWGRDVRWLGHPVIDLLAVQPRPPALGTTPLTVGLFPGSRRAEVLELLPVMRAAALRVAKVHPEVRFVLASATDRTDLLIARDLPRWEVAVEVVRRRAWDVLSRCHALLTCSGTATLEAAVLGVPMVVMYRLRYALDRWLNRLLIPKCFFALPNIVAERAIVPELRLEEAEPIGASNHLLALLEPGPHRTTMLADLAEVTQRLGPPGSIARIADLIEARLGVRRADRGGA